MSNFSKQIINPRNGQREMADFLDNYFGGHQYGVRLKDGTIIREEELMTEEEKALLDTL